MTRSKAYLEIPEPERGAYDGLRLRRSAQGFLRVKATPFQNHVIRPEQAYVACVNAVAAFFHETRCMEWYVLLVERASSATAAATI